MDKYLGKRLDNRYEIKELIGVGGMANVYKSYDINENRTVAIKILKDEFLNSPDFLRRFRNESKAIAVLSHPNIVKVFDVNFGDKIQYIVMEYIDGITLKEFINTQECLTWKESLHFTVQILRSLQHAHDKGIVHRDIKPQNIMLLQDGTIKVMDFGIARFARDDMHTITDKALGTVHYISPEQAKGEPADEKTDIYAVGVMLFEMLTGALPFEADNAVSVAIMQMNSIPKKPTEINDTIPIGLEEITIRAMQKNSVMRYQSAAEMLRDLDSFKKNPSITFEYKYFNDNGNTKYFDTVNISNFGSENNMKENNKNSKTNKNKNNTSKKSKYIPILAGVASAFVIIMLLILVGFGVFSGGNKVEEISMPDLTGQNINNITNDDTYKDLKIEIISTDYTNDYEKDIIFEQNIRPGQRVKKNTLVRVKVSLGKKLIEVPDTYNSDYNQAQQELKNLGFNFTIVRQFDSNIAIDRVIKTEPAKGNHVAKGTEIKIYVSMGKQTQNVTVPNLIGKTESEAKTLLDSLKIKYNISYVNSKEPKGNVVNQSVSPNSVIEEGALIELSISNGKASSSSSQRFSIDLPNGISGTYRFTIYVNGVSKSTQVINVGATSKFDFTLTGSGTQEVTVTIVPSSGSSNEINFVKYNVNFDENISQLIYKDNSAFDKFNNTSSNNTSSNSNNNNNSSRLYTN